MARRVCVLWVVFAAALSSPLPALEFFDDFERPDGMLSEWVEFYPTAEISGGRLSLRASVVNVQPNAWAGVGGEAIFFHDLARVSFGIEFLGTPFDDVGRHGGVLVCGAEPSHRYAVGFSGYFIDWIDRVTDRGFRVFRVDGGAHTLLAQQTDHLDPPEEWTIEFTPAGFRVIADGVPVEYLEPGLGTVGDEGEILDTTYRSGYVGFWCFQNVGQNMLVDDLAITYADNACASLVPWRVRARYEDPSRFISVYIPYGSNAAAPYTVTVTTTDPQVVAFAGAAGDTLDVVFNVGDPQARDIEIVFGDIGTAELRLSVAGTDCPMIVPVEVVPKPTVKFMEDFAGEDGPPTDFYVQSPAVSVEFEELALRATAGVEPHAWAGIAGLPIPCEDIAEIRCNIRFGLNASAPILRHGGVVFCAAAPATRWNNPSYLADYLERDQTFRIVKVSATSHVVLATVPGHSDPGTEWLIELTGSTIRLTVDGSLVAEVTDMDRRSGYVGFWAYNNVGQEFFVDDVEITLAPALCAVTLTPPMVVSRPGGPPLEFEITIPFGLNLSQDYTVTLTSLNPEIAVPAGADASGRRTIVFPAGDLTTRTVGIAAGGQPGEALFELREADEECPPVFARVLVPQEASELTWDFTQDDGAPVGWTVASGAWEVAGGQLTNVPSSPADPQPPWIWAGDPPYYFKDFGSMSFSFGFTGEAPPDVVGRHGGVMFCAQAPLTRVLTSGYELDWIDRLEDRGYRLLRFDDGVQTLIEGPTFDQFFEPGQRWEVRIEGMEIALWVDDEYVFSAYDDTYREGFFGAWVFQNGSQLVLDDLVIGEGVPQGTLFKRGDVNADGAPNIADAIAALSYLFAGGSVPCLDALDVNADGAANIADPITLLQYLFAGGAQPPEPFLNCGSVPPGAPSLGCVSFPPCNP